jgi:tetratricopeptide (TPR) repeat protein
MMFQTVGKNELAKQHMEAGATILDEYGLIGYHDTIPQFINYAVLLSDLGQPDKGLAGLEKLARIIQKNISNQAMDYALVQETMGSIFMTMANIQQATAHFKKALIVYEALFTADSKQLELKKQEWREIYERLYFGRQLQQ